MTNFNSIAHNLQNECDQYTIQVDILSNEHLIVDDRYFYKQKQKPLSKNFFSSNGSYQNVGSDYDRVIQQLHDEMKKNSLPVIGPIIVDLNYHYFIALANGRFVMAYYTAGIDTFGHDKKIFICTYGLMDGYPISFAVEF